MVLVRFVPLAFTCGAMDQEPCASNRELSCLFKNAFNRHTKYPLSSICSSCVSVRVASPTHPRATILSSLSPLFMIRVHEHHHDHTSLPEPRSHFPSTPRCTVPRLSMAIRRDGFSLSPFGLLLLVAISRGSNFRHDNPPTHNLSVFKFINIFLLWWRIHVHVHHTLKGVKRFVDGWVYN